MVVIQKLKIELPYDLASAYVYKRFTGRSRRDICTPMFIVAFTAAAGWN